MFFSLFLHLNSCFLFTFLAANQTMQQYLRMMRDKRDLYLIFEHLKNKRALLQSYIFPQIFSYCEHTLFSPYSLKPSGRHIAYRMEVARTPPPAQLSPQCSSAGWLSRHAEALTGWYHSLTWCSLLHSAGHSCGKSWTDDWGQHSVTKWAKQAPSFTLIPGVECMFVIEVVNLHHPCALLWLLSHLNQGL